MGLLTSDNRAKQDETSSFLDVKQRLAATEVIRSLVDASQWGGDVLTAEKKYVISVEHDLAVLDYMSDHVCCLYGEPGVYGVATQRLTALAGINQCAPTPLARTRVCSISACREQVSGWVLPERKHAIP